MQDSIDKRNFRERCARSIVKGYNVRYVVQEATDAPQAAEAAQEAVQKPDLEEHALQTDQRYAHVPSSQYGTKSVQDPVTKEQIEKILGEQKEDLFEAMKEMQ